MSHYWFYVDAVRAASGELAGLKAPVAMIDRYWMTTIAYHLAVGVAVDIADFGPSCNQTPTIPTHSPELLSEPEKQAGLDSG